MADADADDRDEVKPYRIRVSSKYLDLTKQKLELTRLPHEAVEPASRSKDWWEPKPQVEPLIDFWLEQYSWRDYESSLNESLPQFRTALVVPGADAPLRLHFIHVRSPHADAVPLLLVPPFPFTNLSLGHLVKPLTDPDEAEPETSTPQQQHHRQRPRSFHLVIPSLPGLGFSDALPNNTPVIAATTALLDELMARLGYVHYLATNGGPAAASPAEIDWRIARRLATIHAGSCLGAHLVAPPLATPALREAPLEWAKWSFANFFHAPILGYSADDFAALGRLRGSAAARASSGRLERRKAATPSAPLSQWSPTRLGLGKASLREPNTLSYALCDSPIGLLVLVLKGLRMMGPRKTFTPTEIINFTELAWLPGPEAALRFWAHCARHVEKEEKRAAAAPKPKVSITVFLGEDATGRAEGEGGGSEEGGVGGDADAQDALPRPVGSSYACPSWGSARYDVVFSRRVAGNPGLLAWERPEVIVEGIRGLAKAVLSADPRLLSSQEPATAPLVTVVLSGDGEAAPAAGATSGTVPVKDARAVVASKEKEPKGKEVEVASEAGPSTSPEHLQT